MRAYLVLAAGLIPAVAVAQNPTSVTINWGATKAGIYSNPQVFNGTHALSAVGDGSYRFVDMTRDGRPEMRVTTGPNGQPTTVFVTTAPGIMILVKPAIGGGPGWDVFCAVPDRPGPTFNWHSINVSPLGVTGRGVPQVLNWVPGGTGFVRVD